MLNSPNLQNGRGRVPYSPFSTVPIGSYGAVFPASQTPQGFPGWGTTGDDTFRFKATGAAALPVGSDPFRGGGGQTAFNWGNSSPESAQSSQPKSWLCRKSAPPDPPLCEPVQATPAKPEALPSGSSVKDSPRAQQGRVSGKPSGKAKDGTQQQESSKINGSKLIGAFKITSALVVTGAVNAFFFGVPIYVSSGIAAAVAGAQAFAALKIHKEDTPFTQKLMTFTRKVMGRENDLTPAGKEWSMVPVWAGICGAFGLSEAFLNHVFKESTGYQKKSFEARKKAILDEMQHSRFGLKKAILGKQLKGMAFVESSRQGLIDKFSHWAKQEGGLGKVLTRMSHFLKRFNKGGAARPNYPLIYLWSLGMASFAGATQTAIAALMQQKIDRANGIGKTS